MTIRLGGSRPGLSLWLIVLVVVLLLTAGTLGPVASLITAALVATTLLVVAHLSLGARWRRTRLAWDRADAWIRKGYYCLRDDVCYEHGGTVTWPPETYAAAAVSN